MNILERRRHPRQQTKIFITVRKNGEEIPATIVDMGKGGVGLISDRELTPGTHVKMTVNFVDDYFIHGTVKWTKPQEVAKNKILYRIGVASDKIHTPCDF